MNAAQRKKLAVVTGGSSGIGQSTVLHLARRGVDVLFTHFKDEPGAGETTKLAAEADATAQVSSLPLDLSDARQIGALKDAIESSEAALCYLVNNAATNTLEKSISYSKTALERVLSVNLIGTFLVTQMALQHWMRNRLPGSVVTVTSIHQTIACPDDIAYGMSKAGLDLMTKTFALEYGPHAIRLNNVAPGSVRTPWNKHWLADEKAVEDEEGAIPLGRIGSADQIARVIVQVLSSEFAYVTGQTIFVDGGKSL